ncbi:MAG: hypothetical protein H6558_18610 [Lewinellaceae bacterium]|nr:hypothetical protein [Lewinellaceae bacterium]
MSTAITDIIINGPFWKASGQVVQLTENTTNYTALRKVFIDHPTEVPAPEVAIPIEGTIAALCNLEEVVLTLPGAANPFIFLQPDGQSLLLLRAESMEGDVPAFRCLNGYIGLADDADNAVELDALYQVLELEKSDMGDRTGNAVLPGPLSVHSSGLSIFGAIALPWQTDRLNASFLLTEIQEGEDTTYRLTIEEERLTAGERAAWVESWQRLQKMIDPSHPLNTLEQAGPRWASLELSRLGEVPDIYWKYMKAEAAQKLFFSKGTARLYLADQSVYNESDGAPSAIARLLPDDMRMEMDGDELKLSFGEQKAAADYQEFCHYVAHPELELWAEEYSFSQLALAYDPVQVARRLRRDQGLPGPELHVVPSGETEETLPFALLDAPIIWGYMPLENGWVQLPFLNMSEQVYLDAGLANEEALQGGTERKNFQGGVTYGNEEAVRAATSPISEHPWEITLIDCAAFYGCWTIASSQLAGVELGLYEPEVAVNGFLWLSTGRPSIEDALPTLDNWVNGLFPAPLRSFRAEQSLFPPAFLIRLEAAQLMADNTEGGPSVANLASWSYRYHSDETLIASLAAKGLLEQDAVEQHPPFAWLRHPALPMVQALPLSQSRRPPNYPAASRQLLPFELTFDANGWAFESAGKPAEAWPLIKAGTEAQPAPGWAGRDGLPAVALSLPGLQLLPGTDAATADSPFDALTAAFRLDLPYTDENHALAQLPKVPQDPNISSPLPDAPPPEPPKPLSRETFADHWQELSTLASLAAADAVEAFRDDGSGAAEVKNLAEPLSWPAKATLEDEEYPGTLILQNTTGDENVSLSKQKALKGISGSFAIDSDNKLQLASGQSDGFVIEAHAMAAKKERLAADNTMDSLRDQRGLRRTVANMDDDDHPMVLTTLVELEQDAGTAAYQLTTLISEQPLPLSDGNNWQLWFKGLPLESGNGAFFRSRPDDEDAIGSRSDKNQDINDPEALSKNWNFLQGYEWRLSDGLANTSGKLDLLGLHFYPLTLEKVKLDGSQLEVVEISGRLQLPLTEVKEQEHLSNVVTLTFNTDSGSLQLESIAMETGAVVEWPLEVSAGPAGEVPRLCFSEITLSGGVLAIAHPVVKFLLFDTEWQIELGSLEVADAQSAEWGEEENGSATPGLNLSKVSLFVDLDTYAHRLDTQFAIRLGARVPLSFESKVAFQLTGDSSNDKLDPTIDEHQLFGSLAADGIQARYTRLALEFQWESLAATTSAQVLPGWQLGDAGRQPMPGFATLAFSLNTATASGIPDLELKTAFIEALFLCQWGQLFMDDPLSASPDALFQSSAGDLSFGTTIQFDGKEWRESFLVNGFLEVRNMISWPSALQLNASNELQSPSLADYKVDGDGNEFPHLRHNMRVLFNQHELPASLLKSVDAVDAIDAVLYAFEAGESWQFLAVAEHQLLEVSSSTVNSCIARWAGIQEVRFATPLRYRSFVEYLAGKPLTDAHLAGLEGSSGESLEELPDPITIKGRIINQVGRGLPDVEVELIINDPPVITNFKVTHTDDGGYFEFTFNQSAIDSNTGFLNLALYIGGFSQSKQANLIWTVEMAGQDIILVTEQNVPPIHLFGEEFSEALAEALYGLEQDAVLAEQVLLVEASAIQWLNLQPVANPGFTNLQALPTGQQSAMASSQGDYGISSPENPQWQLLMVPFLGRLQVEESNAANPLSIDPVRQLENINADVPVLLQGFANIAKDAAALAVAGFDLSDGRRWPRLDPNMLEESWFRMLQMPEEGQPPFLQSITAALPDNASRLSRAAALAQAFRGNRPQYPPITDERALPEYGRTATILWRENSLIQFDFASDPEKVATSRQPWLLFALQWQELANSSDEGGATPVYPAATALPTPGQDGMPQAFAASPYLSLRLLPAPADENNLAIEIVSAELLCLEAGKSQLLPFASRLAERASFIAEDPVDELQVEADMIDSLNAWAKSKHNTLCPESPLAMLRLRKIYRNNSESGEEAQLVVRYAFAIVEIQATPTFARRSFNLRAPASQLHFREGQFNGFQLPAETPEPFELAAPQVNGVQPIYFDKGMENPGFTEQLAQELPWGLSTLRLSTRLTEQGKAVIGPAPEEQPYILWWQGLQHFVQFRAAQEGQASAGLPELFRARAIRSFLPALADIPMPSIPATTGENWQSVLPGEMRLLPVGSRAGVYFAYRHQLIRQIRNNGAYETLVSESIPVQHRFPRPVSLPANQTGLEAKALQAWASYFEPASGLHARTNPADETFFAGNIQTGKPARRLQLELTAPAGGTAAGTWDGSLAFNARSESDNGSLAEWAVVLEITLSGLTFTYDEMIFTEADGALNTSLPATAGDDSLQQQWQQAIGALGSGTPLKVKAFVQDKGMHGTDGFQQQLEFPLRMAGDQLPRLPLQPYFTHFEDPEYNRQLASASANATIQLLLGDEFYALRLSTDRKAYNMGSRLAFRIDWLEPGSPEEEYKLELLFKRISKESGKNEEVADWEGLAADENLSHDVLEPAKLFALALPELMQNSSSPLAAGETLQLQLTIKNTLPNQEQFGNTAGQAVLNLDIVAEPLIPNTKSAYALLRAQQGDDDKWKVECRRFAWGPNASRIEMVDADDLLQEIVRRRAVFRWQDTVRPRPDGSVQYGIQKISPNGSTHFPEFE